MPDISDGPEVMVWRERRPSRPRKEPITVERIVSAAFELVEAGGFDALTMRRVAAALETGPASLYAHVTNKAELDDLLIGELSARVEVPTPDPAVWRDQLIGVCGSLRDQFVRYPGISRAALAAVPRSLDTLRVSEGMLGIVLAGGVPARDAAWAIDAAFLYVCAYALESSLRLAAASGVDEREAGAADVAARFASLPADRFPNTQAHARELTSGSGHDRFDFTLTTLLRGLAPKGAAG